MLGVFCMAFMFVGIVFLYLNLGNWATLMFICSMVISVVIVYVNRRERDNSR